MEMVALYMEPEEESAVIKVRIPVYSAPDFLFLDFRTTFKRIILVIGNRSILSAETDI